MQVAGLTRRRDGNDPFGEGFSFASVEEFAAFARVRPDLFDRELDAAERRRRWVEFSKTSVGKALRWR